MKKLMTAMLGIFLSLSAFAQMMPDSTFQIVAYWDKGDKISYQCTDRTVKKSSNGKEEVQKSSSEVRTFEVIDQTDSTYILRMSYSDVFSSQLSLGMGADIMAKIAEQEKVDILTNELGTIQDYLNVEEMLDHLVKGIPMILDAVVAKQDKKELKAMGFDRNQWISQFSAMFSNPDIVVAACNKEVGPLFMYHGTRLDPKEEYVVENEYANVFGAQGLTTQMHFWIDSELSDSVSVVIRSHAEADTETLLPMMRDATLTALRATLSEDQYEEAAAMVLMQFNKDKTTVSFAEDTALEVDLGSGWPVQFVSDRTVSIQMDGETTDVVSTVSIKYKDPEEP